MDKETRSEQENDEVGIRSSDGPFDSTEAEDEVGGDFPEGDEMGAGDENRQDTEDTKAADAGQDDQVEDGDEEDDEPLWYYVEKGERQGPVEESELRQMVWDGKVDNTLVWTPGQQEWQRLSDFPQLMPTRAGACSALPFFTFVSPVPMHHMAAWAAAAYLRCIPAMQVVRAPHWCPPGGLGLVLLAQPGYWVTVNLRAGSAWH